MYNCEWLGFAILFGINVLIIGIINIMLNLSSQVLAQQQKTNAWRLQWCLLTVLMYTLKYDINNKNEERL